MSYDLRMKLEKDQVKKLTEISNFLKLKRDPRNTGKYLSGAQVFGEMIEKFMADQEAIKTLRDECKRLNNELGLWQIRDNVRVSILKDAYATFHDITKRTAHYLGKHEKKSPRKKATVNRKKK